MNSQITLLALAGKWGRPSGGAHVVPSEPKPSRWSIALRANPVKPRPKSLRNVRRSCMDHLKEQTGEVETPALSDRDEIVVVQQSMEQVDARTQLHVPGARRQLTESLQGGLPFHLFRAARRAGEHQGKGDTDKFSIRTGGLLLLQ